jgi:hypothetical protein
MPLSRTKYAPLAVGSRALVGGGRREADDDSRRRASAGELDGVREQVHDYVLEKGRIAHARGHGLYLEFDLVLSPLGAQRLPRPPEEGLGVDRLSFHSLPPQAGESKQVGDQTGHGPGALADLAQVPPRVLRQLAGGVAVEERRKAADGSQRCLKIVGDGIREGLEIAVRRLQLGRSLPDPLLQRHVECLNLLVRPLALRDVADVDHEGADIRIVEPVGDHGFEPAQ